MPPGRSRRRLGNFGEAAAAAYLTRHGYDVLERQWRCASGEIDLIARHEGCLVFVEVRTRSSAAYGSPEESITPTKQQRLIALAYVYLAAHNLDDTTPWRIDVIAIIIDASGYVNSLNHLPGAVEA
jgi:putative endonuclease